MADPFLGQIVLFGGTFAPRGWAFCAGQLLSIAQNSALFSILGTTYGGDGRTTFGLPDLRGRVAIHPGQGPGLSNYSLGQRNGVEVTTLNANQLPSHDHTVNDEPSLDVMPTTDDGNQTLPSTTNRLSAAKLTAGIDGNLYSSSAPDTMLGGLEVSGNLATQNTGGGQAHQNRHPFQAINYIIALSGVFPSRN